MSYDSWKSYDEAGERAGRLQSLIENDAGLDALQRRIDMLGVRHARLAAALKVDPKNGRLAATTDRAACFVRYAERALDAAIDDRADRDYESRDSGDDE